MQLMHINIHEYTYYSFPKIDNPNPPSLTDAHNTHYTPYSFPIHLFQLMHMIQIWRELRMPVRHSQFLGTEQIDIHIAASQSN